MGEPRLAEQLRTKYCKTEGAAGQLAMCTKLRACDYQRYKLKLPISLPKQHSGLKIPTGFNVLVD